MSSYYGLSLSDDGSFKRHCRERCLERKVFRLFISFFKLKIEIHKVWISRLLDFKCWCLLLIVSKLARGAPQRIFCAPRLCMNRAVGNPGCPL